MTAGDVRKWGRTLAQAGLVLGLLLLAVSGGALPESGSSGSLKGSFLVAAPGLADPNFSRTVVFMIEHDSSGAFGLIVNRRLGSGPLAKFMSGFGLPAEGAEGDIDLYAGGPVKGELGFVLHSPDYRDESTRAVTPTVSMSTNLSLLLSVARNKTPKRLLFAFGYSGWGPGQLEQELARKDWLIAPGDADLVFERGDAEKWSKARKAAGITL